MLALSLMDDDGNLLLPAGSPLSSATLRGLRRRGVEMIAVVVSEADPTSAPAEDLGVRMDRLAKHMRVLFRHSQAEGQVNPLFHIVLNYRQSESP